MNQSLLQRISREAGIPDLIEVLSERLSAADLNSILLEIFSNKSAKITPAELLRNYQLNRFVQPASIDPLAFSDFSLNWLRASKDAGFTPLQLSPVCPMGTCSVVATAHQHKIISAVRGTEIVADSTNVLALETATQRKAQGFPNKTLCFSTLHRHVRAQEIPDIPGFSPHFTILGLTSAGRDTGNFYFEKENLRRHLQFYKTQFEERLQISPVKFRLINLQSGTEENRLFQAVYNYLQKIEPAWIIEKVASAQQEQAYYHRLQFKILIPNPLGGVLEIADGGFTDWINQLTSNQKERFLISGIGLELLFKLQNGLT